VLGIVGLVGAGKTELAKSIVGYFKYDSGSMKVNGEDVKIKNVKSGIEEGVVYLTEERIMEGIFPQMSVMENMFISSFGGSITSLIRNNELKKRSMEWIKKLNIVCKDVDQKVLELSGGNQQKVLLARFMMMGKEIFIMDEPTKGIDIKSKEEIYELVRKLKEGGNGVIFISSDIDEILRISNRTLVMSDGRIVAQCTSNMVKKSDILEVMFK
jgi:ribose transport system ATP-binding protein